VNCFVTELVTNIVFAKNITSGFFVYLPRKFLLKIFCGKSSSKSCDSTFDSPCYYPSPVYWCNLLSGSSVFERNHISECVLLGCDCFWFPFKLFVEYVKCFDAELGLGLDMLALALCVCVCAPASVCVYSLYVLCVVFC